MDFEDFAQQFRKRAADRLTEFEKTLEKAQRDLEKSAERAAAQGTQHTQVQHQGQQGQQPATGQTRNGQWPQNRPLDYRTPDIPGAANSQPKQQTPVPRKAPGNVKPVQAKPGQIKSVLRRG